MRPLALALVAVAALAFSLFAPRAWADTPDIAGEAQVIDGNTINVDGREVVLWGINAPHGEEYCDGRGANAYPCGRSATQALSILLRQSPVSCTFMGEDAHGAMRAKCTSEGRDIAQMMVLNGWAIANRDEGEDYRRDERAAWSTREGMWKSKTFRREDVKGRIR